MPRRRSRSTGGVPASPPISGRGSWGSWPSLSCPRSPCGGSVRRSGGGGGGSEGRGRWPMRRTSSRALRLTLVAFVGGLLTAGLLPGEAAAAVRPRPVLILPYPNVTAGGGISIVPRLVEAGKGEGQTLEALIGTADRILETQADLIPIYARALKLGLKPDELGRAVAAAKPTTNLTAFEAYAKGRRSYLKGGQEGYEGAAELFAPAAPGTPPPPLPSPPPLPP